MKTEAKLEAALVRECKRRGLYCRKFASPAHAGVPDRIIAGHGKVLFLELKSPGNKPTPLQQRELDELKRLGMVAAWTDTFEGVVSLLNNQWPDCV